MSFHTSIIENHPIMKKFPWAVQFKAFVWIFCFDISFPKVAQYTNYCLLVFFIFCLGHNVPPNEFSVLILMYRYPS